MSKPIRILLLEDDASDAALFERELRRGGYDPDCLRVSSGSEMEDALDHERFDLVVSDYSMPSFDALAGLKLLRNRSIDVPFLIVSGTITEDMAVAAMRAGANDYLTKGNLKRLLPAIDRELREAEGRRQQRRLESRFETLVDSMDELVVSLDTDRRIDGVYGRALDRAGVSNELLLGKTARELLGDAAAPHERAMERTLRGEPVIYEATFDSRQGDGSRHYQISLSPLRDAGDEVTGIVGVARDITEQKAAQAQLLVADRMVSVGTLAAGVAHEINNPLAAVIANLELAARDFEDLVAEAPDSATAEYLREELRDAREGAERVRLIVRDLKLFSRGEDDSRGPVDVHRVLDSSVRMAWNEIRHRARLDKVYGPIPEVEANESRLGQVFLNLLVNASQAIPEGTADQQVIRIVTRTDASGRAIVEISDSGPGIPPDVFPRLFTPFFTTKPVGVGTGLGLSICHRIVSGLGGDIVAESSPGKGALFRVILPPAHSATAILEPVAPVVAPAPRRGHVLIVDDEAVLARSLQRALTHEHDVVVATRAEQALARIAAGERFDVILCDLMMPQMTGMQLHDAIAPLAADQAKAMVFLTGGAFTPEAQAFLARIVNPRFDKPFDVTALRNAVNEMIRRADDKLS
jgi:PAS domain S-box-containing protein